MQLGEGKILPAWWAQLVPLIADGVKKYEDAYALVARLADAPPLPAREEVIEGEVVEDAEVLELEPAVSVEAAS